MRPFDIAFKRFNATPLNKEDAKVLVSWELQPTKVDLSDYEFYVDRGQTPEQVVGKQDADIDGFLQKGAAGPAPITHNMYPLNAQPISALDYYEYADFTPELRSLSAELYYRIRCRRISTGEEIMTPAFTWQGKMDLMALYIVDEQNFQLKDAAGQPCLIYNRRRGGIPCKCFDPVQQKRLYSNCKVCYGTNWTGGFYPALGSYTEVKTADKDTSIQEWGEIQPGNTLMRFTNYPVIKNGDLVRTIVENRLWRVAKVKEFEKRVVPMMQYAQLVEVNPGDVEYSIPLNEDLVRKLLLEYENILNKREF